MTESAFWTAKRRRFWTIGAVLILITGGVVLGTYLVASRPEGVPREAARGELSAFVSDEHKAAFKEGAKPKFPVSDEAALGDSLRDWVGSRLTMEELFPGGGVKFMSAGKSAVPGAGESAHLRLGAGEVKVSVFIKQYRKLPVLEDGAAYTLAGRNLGAEAPPITVWRRGGLVCFLVAENAAAMKALREGMRAPEPKKAY